MAYLAVHQENLEDGNRGEDRAYREEQMAWEGAVAKEVPLKKIGGQENLPDQAKLNTY